MANLAEAVDATETDWIISADLDDDIDYLTVEDEIVKVTANFPAQYQAATGTTSVPRIRVERAAGGTTAASHADTTALTPLIPPAAAGAGGGALSVDNTVDPPEDVTTIVASGAVVGGGIATLGGKDFYAQDTDPGAVGAGSVWKDTSVVSYEWWERNAADDGWNATFDVGAIATDADAGAGITANRNGVVAGVTVSSSEALGSVAEVRAETIDIIADPVAGVLQLEGASVVASTAAEAVKVDLNADGSLNLTSADGAITLNSTGNGNVTLNADGDFIVNASGVVTLLGLPTADPVNAGQLWVDVAAGRVLKVSAG